MKFMIHMRIQAVTTSTGKRCYNVYFASKDAAEAINKEYGTDYKPETYYFIDYKDRVRYIHTMKKAGFGYTVSIYEEPKP